jgi:transposase
MRIFVKRTEKAKYACPCCKGHREDPDAPSVIRTASAPPAIIPGSIASASLLAHVFSNKFENHLPYFRQEKQFAQIGVNVSRQDMVNWQVKVFEILLPLLALLLDTLKSGPVIRMDETTVQVMGEEDRKDTQKSYMWLARGGPPDKPVVIFKYHPSRASEHVNEFIEGFTGFLQTDGYGGYDCALKTHPAVVHVGCFAHARRKFFEAEKCGSQSRPASVALGYIRQLYAIEKELRDKALPDRDFLNQRKERALPVLTAFKKWLDKK